MTPTPSPQANDSTPLEGGDSDTTAEAPASPIEAPEPKRDRRSTIRLAVGALTFLALIAVALYLPMPYVVNQPGPTFDVIGASEGTPMIDIKPQSGSTDELTLDPVPGPTSDIGQLRMVTVAQIGGPGNRLNLVDYLLARLDPKKEIVRYSDVYPSEVTRTDVEEQQAAQMASSQSSATSVALQSLGMDVPATVKVAGAVAGSSADGAVQAGDLLVSLTTPDGTTHPVGSADVPFRVMRTVPPDSTMTVSVERDGKQIDVPITTREAGLGEQGSKLGLYLTADVKAPLDITIHLEKVGGPSAGMMFALGIVDRLTPGDMTGGQVIAGTGSLSFDGQVDPIGGIQQKMWGALDDGAKWFLAPSRNCDEVVGHVPDGLSVVKVSDFTEARAAVEAIAAGEGAGLPQCTQADADALQSGQSGD